MTIVGVDSPEFAWERPLAKVRTAIEKLMITFPVYKITISLLGSAMHLGLADNRPDRQERSL